MLFFSLPLYISKRAAKQYLELYEENELQLDRNECYRQKKRSCCAVPLFLHLGLPFLLRRPKGLHTLAFDLAKTIPEKEGTLQVLSMISNSAIICILPLVFLIMAFPVKWKRY